VRLHPSLVSFIRKGIWLHVELSLRLQADSSYDSSLVIRATERFMTLKSLAFFWSALYHKHGVRYRPRLFEKFVLFLKKTFHKKA
jgi:hypothetical protein